ncbi:MAG: threonylcarbamoyl-AMP synthase, partial [Firmicutes bacterium]|nr:threonylcarbamoyl-AMP synthase [Bacillota bacterium]
AGLYSALRRFNELGVDVILAEGLEEKGVGLAVMNRLKKAAGGRIIQV